jgi:TetR/AcrR family transcriptional repressor of nem operon
MRYPADHKQATRTRIVRAAARRFRSRGSEGAAISDLMRDLRLTHGGFYRHFDSKEDLFAEAFAVGLEQLSERLVRAAEAAPRGGELRALIDAYLSPEHCDDAANGCPVAALMSEVARRPGATRGAFQQAMRAHIARMARYVPGLTDEERQRKAVMLFSGMAGTLNVARALTDQRRRRVLEDARTFYLKAVGGRFCFDT